MLSNRNVLKIRISEGKNENSLPVRSARLRGHSLDKVKAQSLRQTAFTGHLTLSRQATPVVLRSFAV